MKIGYFSIGIGPLTDPEWVRAAATTAERVGFSTLWAPEHIVLVDEFSSKYPYSAGEFSMPTNTPIADPFATLSLRPHARRRFAWRPESAWCRNTIRSLSRRLLRLPTGLAAAGWY
jgi:hypothetical protein